MQKPSKKLIVYNTLARKQESFSPMKEGHINMFVCGQTVYDDAHLGHAKVYINFSVVVRWLRHLGYKLRYAQSITDIDDKIIARAKEKGEEAITLARHFEKRYLEDMDAIGVKKDVDEYLRSHDYIDVIAKQIGQLMDNGFAYQLEGDVYYDVARFPDYTKLSGMKIDELEEHRIEPRKGKKNVYDFALWKAAKPGEPSWKAEVKHNGKGIMLDGRPGWHIEDTAMTYKVFGEQYDLHGGGTDLIFPHHTNEIAQAEGASGKKPFVKYWMHAGLVNVNAEKMSKSLKNFITIRDALKHHDAEAIRVWVVSTHYRKEINYTERLLVEAEKRLRYMYASFSIFYNMPEGMDQDSEEVVAVSKELEELFTDAMNKDVNSSSALMALSGAIDKLRSFAERNESVESDAKKKAIKSVLEYATVLGILQKDTYKEKLPIEADKLIREREKLRAGKKFDEADKIRDMLKKDFGIVVEDSEYGTIWYKG